MSSKLSKRDKKLLDTGRKITPGTAKYEGGLFGGVTKYGYEATEDFVQISVIEPATDRVIISKEIAPLIMNENIVVKPGIDLRNLGFVSGRFKFKYEF